MTSPEEVVLGGNKLWSVLFWCSPSWVGFALFLVSFPIYRPIPFWPHLQLAEIFILWFLFITPVATVIAIVMLMKRRRRSTRLANVIAWLAITVSVLANVFVLLGMAG